MGTENGIERRVREHSISLEMVPKLLQSLKILSNGLNIVLDSGLYSLKLVIKLVKEIDLDDIRCFLTEPDMMPSSPTVDTPESALLALDVILRHRPTTPFIPTGRSLFIATQLTHGVELWNGFHQSLRFAQNQLLFNINTTTAAFYEPGENRLSTKK